MLSPGWALTACLLSSGCLTTIIVLWISNIMTLADLKLDRINTKDAAAALNSRAKYEGVCLVASILLQALSSEWWTWAFGLLAVAHQVYRLVKGVSVHPDELRTEDQIARRRKVYIFSIVTIVPHFITVAISIAISLMAYFKSDLYWVFKMLDLFLPSRRSRLFMY